MPVKFEVAVGPVIVQGPLVDIDPVSGRATALRRVQQVVRGEEWPDGRRRTPIGGHSTRGGRSRAARGIGGPIEEGAAAREVRTLTPLRLTYHLGHTVALTKLAQLQGRA